MHTVVIAVGTNMGHRLGNVQAAMKMLQSDPKGQTKVVDTSFLYESEPMHVLEQARFLNGAFRITTALEPFDLLCLIKEIEGTLGRQKTIENGPRPIDLDIIYFDSMVLDKRKEDVEDKGWLRIPHASIAEREFVLRPLADLIPDFEHPLLGQSSKHLLSTLLSLPGVVSELGRVVPLSHSLAHRLGSRTLVMSIINATPDSFSDGGDAFALDDAIAKCLEHVRHGTDILDIGGMSTRPGAILIDEEVEIARVVPVISALRSRGVDTPISIDTFRPNVARAAIAAGADIVNDVLGGSHPGMLEAMAQLDCPVILMHSRGDPQTMSSMVEYPDGVVAGVRQELDDRVQAALAAGVKRWNVIIDPGIGFAKEKDGNLAVLRDLPRLQAAAAEKTFPLVVGLSRKKFLGTLTGAEGAPKERIWATAAGVTASIAGGVDIVRVHDVKEMVNVVKVADAIYRQ